MYFRPRKLLFVKASVCKDCVEACLYRARPWTRTRPLRLFARLSTGSSHEPPFIQNAVIRAVAATMCAGMHYLMKMATNASDRFGFHFGISPFHTEEKKEERDIQGYICTPDFTEASYYIYGKYHHLVKELHFHPYKFHRVKPGPCSTKTKELIGLQEIVRATIA